MAKLTAKLYAGLAAVACLACAAPAAGAEANPEKEALKKRISEVNEQRSDLRHEAYKLKSKLHEIEREEAACKEKEKTPPEEMLVITDERVAAELDFMDHYAHTLKEQSDRLTELSSLIRTSLGDDSPYEYVPRTDMDEVYASLGFGRRWPASDAYDSATGLEIAARGTMGCLGEGILFWEAPRAGYMRYSAASPDDEVEVATFGFTVAKTLTPPMGPVSLYFGGGTGFVSAQSVNGGKHKGMYAELDLGLQFDAGDTIDLGVQLEGFWARPGGFDLDAVGVEFMLLLTF